VDDHTLPFPPVTNTVGAKKKKKKKNLYFHCTVAALTILVLPYNLEMISGGSAAVLIIYKYWLAG